MLAVFNVPEESVAPVFGGSHDISAFELVPALKRVSLLLSVSFLLSPLFLCGFYSFEPVCSIFHVVFILFVLLRYYHLPLFSVSHFLISSNFRPVFLPSLSFPLFCSYPPTSPPPSIHVGNGIAVLSRFILELVPRMRAVWKDSTFKTRTNIVSSSGI